MFIFGFTCLIHGSTSIDLQRFYDFGILDIGCSLDIPLKNNNNHLNVQPNIISLAFNFFCTVTKNLMIIYTILWNSCWTYELYISVKNPMIFSEMSIGIYNKVFYVTGILIFSFLYFISGEFRSAFSCHSQQKGELYKQYYLFSTIVVIVISLFVNLSYGRNKYLQTFRK